MALRTPPFAVLAEEDIAIQRALLPKLVAAWLFACDISERSPRTISARQEALGKLLWFLDYSSQKTLTTDSLRAFFSHVKHGHTDAAGRWGRVGTRWEAADKRPVSPGTVATYHRILRAFFSWLVTEGRISSSPMERLPVPIDRPDQIVPFSDDQVRRLLAAAKRGKLAERNTAICLMLLDTGVRAEELCGLRICDLDIQGSAALVEGKGGKSRQVPFSPITRRALALYVQGRDPEREMPVFLSERGANAAGPLTRIGLRLMIVRLGEAAHLTEARCTTHTFRHTFAISFLRAGGNVFTLQQMLGHTSLSMTNRYVAIAQADINRQHAQFSPVSKLLGKRR